MLDFGQENCRVSGGKFLAGKANQQFFVSRGTFLGKLGFGSINREFFSNFWELMWKIFQIICKTFQQVCRNCILTVRGALDEKHIWKNHQAFAIPRLRAEQLRTCEKVPEGLSDQHSAGHEEKFSEKAWIQKSWSFSFFCGIRAWIFLGFWGKLVGMVLKSASHDTRV